MVAPTTENGFNVLSLDLVAVACLKLQDVLFEFDSSFPNTKVATMLAQLPALRESHRNAKGEATPLSIFGHADPVGDDNYNKQLSGRRAIAIFSVLTRDLGLWNVLFDTPAGGDNWKANNFQEVMRKAVGAATGKSRKELSQAYMDLLCPSRYRRLISWVRALTRKTRRTFRAAVNSIRSSSSRSWRTRPSRTPSAMKKTRSTAGS